jgi:hypothetical protein
MSKLAISQTPTTITVVDQETAKVYTITNTQPNWNKVVAAVKLEDNDDEIVQLMSVKGAIENFSPTGAITVVGNDVKYKSHILAGLDVDHLLEAIRTGNQRQAKSLTLFLENKQLNPSYKAINMMYKFRQDKGMPLTDDGCFLAYKGVMKDYWSRNGNRTTVVLSGAVNEGGHILNAIDAYIEVDRKCVEDDPDKGCGEGLHAGSLEYATGWGEKVVIVKIHPKDVVSVPKAEDNKMRICAYTVVGECEGRMPEHFSKDLDQDTSDYEGCEDECPDCGSDLEGAGECYNCGWNPEDWNPEDEDCQCDTCEASDTAHSPSTVNQYDAGYQAGTKDGKAKTKRQYYAGDEPEVPAGQYDYIAGYNRGYSLARYGK